MTCAVIALPRGDGDSAPMLHPKLVRACPTRTGARWKQCRKCGAAVSARLIPFGKRVDSAFPDVFATGYAGPVIARVRSELAPPGDLSTVIAALHCFGAYLKAACLVDHTTQPSPCITQSGPQCGKDDHLSSSGHMP